MTPVDLTGKRVAVIGTGSSGIQAIPLIAEQAEHLFVFQRTPAFSMPSGNRPLDAAFEQEWKANYPQRRAEMLQSWGVSLIEYPQFSAHDCTPEQQQEILAYFYYDNQQLEADFAPARPVRHHPDQHPLLNRLQQLFYLFTYQKNYPELL